LKKECQQAKYKQRGKVATSAHVGSTSLPHNSSSSTQRSQELNASRENNEGCEVGGYGSDPPYFNMEKSHIVGHTQKKGALTTKVLKTMKTREII
jgi:hypothetical protein